MFNSRSLVRPALLIALALALLLAGCGSLGRRAPTLRINNTGTTDIKNLTVLFPEDQIHFGDVAAGETTEYKKVPHGVYPYAAYRLEIAGQLVTQPVIDWVGEMPLKGSAFTYTLAPLDGRPEVRFVEFIGVTRDDEPDSR